MISVNAGPTPELRVGYVGPVTPSLPVSLPARVPERIRLQSVGRGQIHVAQREICCRGPAGRRFGNRRARTTDAHAPVWSGSSGAGFVDQQHAGTSVTTASAVFCPIIAGSRSACARCSTVRLPSDSRICLSCCSRVVPDDLSSSRTASWASRTCRRAVSWSCRGLRSVATARR